MLGVVHGLPGSDFVTGALALSVLILGAVLAALAVLGVIAFRRAGTPGPAGAVWRGSLVLVGAVLAWLLLDRSTRLEHAADRRAFEARAAELTARAIAPGSALACLDAVANGPVEAACERSLFASPEATAAAVAYVDARLSLFAAGLALAARDPSYEPALQRLRRALETDRYGFVAHVLTTRGCNASDCPDLKLLRDPGRILVNMKARSFETQVVTHGSAWHPSAASVAAIPPPSGALEHAPKVLDQATGTAPLAAAPAGATSSASTPYPPVPSQYELPSAASIPPISIMNAEPPLPAEPRTAAPVPTPQPRQSAPAPQPRRQTQREAPRESAPPHQPLSVLPEGVTASGQGPTQR
jgi:hypothetical protein